MAIPKEDKTPKSGLLEATYAETTTEQSKRMLEQLKASIAATGAAMEDIKAKIDEGRKAAKTKSKPSPTATAAKAAAMPPSPVPAVPPPPEDLLATIRRWSPAFKDIAAGAGKEEYAEEPKKNEYTPPATTIPDGFTSLADLVAGCKAVPVRVFEPTDWPDAIRSYIPQSLPNGGKWHWPVELVNDLAFALSCDDRTLLHGPTGSGKSALVDAWCYLTKTPLIRVNCHREMQSTDFLGKDIIKATPQGPVLEYDWSLTTLAAKHGGMLLIDEAFRSPHLMAIQSLLERNGALTLPDAASLTPAERHIVPPRGKSWIVLTDNSVGTGDDTGAYVTEVQDVSTLDRITAAIHVDYTDAELEASELAEDFPGVPIEVTRQLTGWAAAIRQAFKSGNMQQTVSRRALGAILRKYVLTGNIAGAARLSFVNKLGPADQHKAREAWMQIFGKELDEMETKFKL